ncbi:MAG: hypothetical protein JSS82_14025 [Bacteroidetes bacterium]|nr:hypothetical protein [Bacteroidota bacterium]
MSKKHRKKTEIPETDVTDRIADITGFTKQHFPDLLAMGCFLDACKRYASKSHLLPTANTITGKRTADGKTKVNTIACRWYGKNARPEFIVGDFHKIQRLDQIQHDRFAVEIGDELKRVEDLEKKQEFARKMKTAVTGWIQKQPFLYRLYQSPNNHVCDVRTCKKHFVKLFIREWQSRDGTRTHVCVTDANKQATYCLWNCDPHGHGTELNLEENIYVCMKYGHVHWCRDKCPFMTHEYGYCLTCPISGRSIEHESKLRHVGDDIKDQQNRSGAGGSMERDYAVARIQKKDPVQRLDWTDLKDTWTVTLINHALAEDIHTYKQSTAPTPDKTSQINIWAEMACDVWCLFCLERYDREEKYEYSKMDAAHISGIRSVNKTKTKWKEVYRSGGRSGVIEHLSTIDIVTKFYSKSRPRMIMAPLDQRNAARYLISIVDTLNRIRNVLSEECRLRNIDFIRDLPAFTVGTVYLMASGVRLPSVVSGESNKQLLDQHETLKDMLPPQEIACELTNVTKKRATTAANIVKDLIIQFGQKNLPFVTRLNTRSEFIRIE